MTNLNDPENDGRSPSKDYWVMATYFGDEDEIFEEQIGTIVLPRDITHNDMPFELEINGTVYKRED